MTGDEPDYIPHEILSANSSPAGGMVTGKERDFPANATIDADLWQAIQRGDERAWRSLVIKYKSLVYSVCLCAGLSQVESADIFQDTWFLLYRNRQSIHDPCRLASWLITTARREAVRCRRRNSRYVAPEGSIEPVDPAQLPDQQLEDLEQQALLEVALSEIDQPCRRLLNSFFFSPEERSYEEIARALGYSPNTLGAKRRRCMERLKQILKAKGLLD